MRLRTLSLQSKIGLANYPIAKNMTENISDDSAWIKEGAGTYRHYCGASIARDGRLWTAKTVAGTPIPGHTTALTAIISLRDLDRQFWTFGQYGPQMGTIDCGSVHHKTMPTVWGEDEVFVFCLSKGGQIPKFLKTIIDKALCWYGNLCRLLSADA